MHAHWGGPAPACVACTQAGSGAAIKPSLTKHARHGTPRQGHGCRGGQPLGCPGARVDAGGARKWQQLQGGRLWRRRCRGGLMHAVPAAAAVLLSAYDLQAGQGGRMRYCQDGASQDGMHSAGAAAGRSIQSTAARLPDEAGAGSQRGRSLPAVQRSKLPRASREGALAHLLGVERGQHGLGRRGWAKGPQPCSRCQQHLCVDCEQGPPFSEATPHGVDGYIVLLPGWQRRVRFSAGITRATALA